MRRPGWRIADMRLVLIGIVFTSAWVGIGFRLVNVQGLNAADYAARGESQRIRTEELPAKRGTIFDRDGVEVAVSIDAVTMVANPSQLADPVVAATLIAPLVGVDADVLEARFSIEGSEFAYVARRMERDSLGEVQALIESQELEGFYFIDEPKRVYPAGTLASQVLGFVQDDDGVGIEGLEYQFDGLLRGAPGTLVVERDPFGNPIPQGQFLVDPAVPGADLVLTIDRGIQFLTQRALEQALVTTNALAGSIVVLDPRTGEILAVANAPTFDPNDRTGVDPALFRNRAIADVYEPGSTLKVVTIAAALEEGIVAADTALTVPKKIVIHDKTFFDPGRRRKAKLTVADIVAKSSNIGTIIIQNLLGNQAHFDYLDAFGLGQPASAQFPAEAAGSLQPASEWCRTTCGPSTAIGYRVDVTPLQMAAVFATIANDGIWVEPHIVREILPGDGEAQVFEPRLRSVLSEGTARTMQQLLGGVVTEGTGTRAQVAGYTVGGKTGTTEKFVPGEGYSDDDRIASFIGMAPLTDPRIVVAVALDSPNGEIGDGVDLRFGGVSAAPVFAEVVEATLNLLGVRPDRGCCADG